MRQGDDLASDGLKVFQQLAHLAGVGSTSLGPQLLSAAIFTRHALCSPYRMGDLVSLWSNFVCG